MTRGDCQLWRFDSAATETPALHVEPGQLNAICVEHTTQMTLFRCAVSHPCGHARSIINSIIGMYWTPLRYQPVTLRTSNSARPPPYVASCLRSVPGCTASFFMLWTERPKSSADGRRGLS